MTNKTTDLVCGMQVVIADDTLHIDHAGVRHYFCSQHCLDRFQANPASFIKLQVIIPEASATVYTCQMHPEVRLPVPGNCPKCGMTLEPIYTGQLRN